MKRSTLALLLLFTMATVAQSNSINYKALIKDDNNAVVSNTLVTLQFSILQGVAQTNVYQETHTPTTDANGIIILNIGDGTVNSGVYADIVWASDDHFLNTQIDSGSGLTDMGTTGFNAVPYALSAKTSETATNVTGLEAIDEGNGNGLVKVGRVAANYGNIGENAVDLSYYTATSTRGATGDLSTAMGFGTTASGTRSTSMGYFTEATGLTSTTMGTATKASGNHSTAMGRGTEASGNHSTAMGTASTATGYSSTAMGLKGTAESYAQTSLGSFNVPTTPISATAFNALDRLLVVGNGDTSSTASDALVILKNGTVTAPSLDISEITDAKALVTKEFADANYTGVASTGLETLDEGNGNGLVRAGRVAANYGNVGNTAVDLSYSGTASATRGATGIGSFAMGAGTTSSGIYAFTSGIITTASGNRSTAMGEFTTASGESSSALGSTTVASANYSTAMGRVTTAESYSQTTMGSYNVPTTPNSATAFNALDRLLVVGNGEAGATSDALVILKNGNATLAGALTQNSDRRLKTDITDLDYGLNTILQLNPVSYYWKKHRDSQSHRSLGLIAQEVQPILKELVHLGSDKDGTLSLDYVSLVPVLIKGMQEQQALIDTQAKKIEALEKKEKLYASIEARLSALETANSSIDDVAVATTETTKN